MEYRNRLRSLRKDRYLKQKEIAELLCVSQRTYSDYETGRIMVPVESLLYLAKFYDVSLDFILGVSDDKRPFPDR